MFTIYGLFFTINFVSDNLQYKFDVISIRKLIK